MAETMDRATLLDTIKKLLDKQVTKGATPAEAASAAAMAAKLCAKHGLSMLEVEKHKLKESGFGCVKESHESFYKELPAWARLLCGEVARAFDCTLFYDWMPVGQFDAYGRTGFKRLIHFMGVEVDAVIARYLYVRLENELYEMATEAAKKSGYRGAQVTRYRNNFIQAAAMEIGKRLRDLRAELKRTEPKFGAMILVKQDLVKTFYDEQFPPEIRKSMPSINISTGAGTREGVMAGRNIDLAMNRVGGQSSSNGNIE